MIGRYAVALATAVLLAWFVSPGAAQTGQYRTADGLAVYLGLMPAAMLKGHPRQHTESAMQGGAPAGRHAGHLTIAVFDAASGARIGDAKVEARVSELGLAGPRRRLEPMAIGDTVTFGNYFDMPGEGPYQIRVWIGRPGRADAVETEFTVEHRLR